MLGSLRIAEVRGIPVRLNVTLLVVFGLLVVRFGWVGVPAGVLLFGSVLLHELGHAVVAQRFGIRIAGIDLHLLGGVALMAEPPKNARQEIWIAAAGPAVSLLLAVLFGGLAVLTGSGLGIAGELRPIDLLAYAGAVNLGMALFNLLPALPMDGGRIFRAALAGRLGHLRATDLAATVSRGFAVLFVVAALYYGAWSLLLIGGFLFLLVGREQQVARMQEMMRRHRADVLGFAHYAAAAPGPGGGWGAAGPVIDVSGGVVRETREELIDQRGRRIVVVTRIVP